MGQGLWHSSSPRVFRHGGASLEMLLMESGSLCMQNVCSTLVQPAEELHRPSLHPVSERSFPRQQVQAALVAFVPAFGERILPFCTQ